LTVADDRVGGSSQPSMDGHLAAAPTTLMPAEVVDGPHHADAERPKDSQLCQEAGISQPCPPTFAPTEVAMRPVQVDDGWTRGTEPCRRDRQERDAAGAGSHPHLYPMRLQRLREEVLVGVRVGRQDDHAKGLGHVRPRIPVPSPDRAGLCLPQRVN